MTHGHRKAISDQLKRKFLSALPGLMIIALIISFRLLCLFQTIEWATFDAMLRLRPPEPTDTEILIVGINEEDIARLKTYPIPDQTIAEILQQVAVHQPAVIGLDIFRDFPIEPGHAELMQQLTALDNIVVIDKVLPDRAGFTIPPPAALLETPDKIGFADAIPDTDGRIRRSILGTYPPLGDYRHSLTIRLAERYLAAHGFSLENGRRDLAAMRFGAIELPRFRPNTGAYIRADAAGTQVLINFRSGPEPFRTVSWQTLRTGDVPPEWIEGNIVLIGIMAQSAPDEMASAAVNDINPALLYGVEVQAHAVSQITSAVLNDRPLLKAWPNAWEYLWIVAWGLVGIGLGQVFLKTLPSLLYCAIALFALMGLGYGLLLVGWWVPIVPPLLALVLNLIATTFYYYNRALKVRIDNQKFVIEQVFNIIHSGPLQDLEVMTRDVQDEALPSNQIHPKLMSLKSKLRSVRDYSAKVLELDGDLFYFDTLLLDLKRPTHKLLAEIYNHTLSRDFPHFKGLKCALTTFEAFEGDRLTYQQKKELCWFLEGALCNIGKYAEGARRLEVICKPERGRNIIRILDDGVGFQPSREGQGTRQAKDIARQLKGQFRCIPNVPRGTLCELSWRASRKTPTRFFQWLKH